MIFPFVLAATLILLLQSPAPLTPKTAERGVPRCTISGRVVTSADGTPLKSSRLALIGEHESRDTQLYAAMSDSEGRFTIKDVPAGRYHFYAMHTGYVDQEYQSHGTDTGAILALQPGQEIKDVIFRLSMAAVITGRLNDEDGDPMGLIVVVALRRPTEEELEDRENLSPRPELRPAATAQTDDRGQYRMFGLKPGEYYIQAKDEYEPQGMIFGHDWEIRRSLGSEYAPAYYPGVTQFAQAEAVNVGAGEEAQADFIMRRVKTVELSGRVIGADGKAPSDVFVYLQELPAPDYGILQSSEVDAKGEFKIKGVVPGSYVVHAQQHASEDAGYQASQKLEVGNENIDSIALALGRGVTFMGRVEVSGSGTVHYDQLFLSLFSREEQSTGAWARVKKDGTFTLLDVSDGNYGLSMNGLETGWYVKAIRSGATDVLRKGLDVEKAEGGGTIRILVANDGAQLEGSVKQSDKPLVGAHVRLRPEPETPYAESLRQTTSTDQSGHFSFIAIAPGQYRVMARTGSGANALVSDPQAVNFSEREHKSVELTIPERQTQ